MPSDVVQFFVLQNTTCCAVLVLLLATVNNTVGLIAEVLLPFMLASSIGLVVTITTLVAEGLRFESRGVLLLYSVTSLVLSE